MQSAANEISFHFYKVALCHNLTTKVVYINCSSENRCFRHWPAVVWSNCEHLTCLHIAAVHCSNEIELNCSHALTHTHTHAAILISWRTTTLQPLKHTQTNSLKLLFNFGARVAFQLAAGKIRTYARAGLVYRQTRKFLECSAAAVVTPCKPPKRTTNAGAPKPSQNSQSNWFVFRDEGRATVLNCAFHLTENAIHVKLSMNVSCVCPYQNSEKYHGIYALTSTTHRQSQSAAPNVRYKRDSVRHDIRKTPLTHTKTAPAPAQPIVTPLILSIPRHIQFEFRNCGATHSAARHPMRSPCTVV